LNYSVSLCNSENCKFKYEQRHTRKCKSVPSIIRPIQTFLDQQQLVLIYVRNLTDILYIIFITHS